MDFELALARQIHLKHGIPIASQPKDRIDRDAGAMMRRAIRVESDAIIHKGLIGGSMEELAAGLGGTMTSTAGALLQLGVSPKIGDLVAAAKELLEDARVLIDNGIAFSELDQVAVGAVAVEVICRGIAATLAVPYRQVLEACALSYIDGKPADREALRAILAQGKAEGRKIEADAAATASRKPVRAKKRSKAKPPEPVKAVTSGSICPICQGNVPCGEVGHPGVA